MKKAPFGGLWYRLGSMARWLLPACLLLSACGGGGGSPDEPVIPPPPNCCASLAAIDAEFDAAETNRLAEYETRRNNAENARAGNGTFFAGSHLAEIRNMAILAASDWSNDALAIVDSYSDEGISPDVADLVEDYRDSLMGYVLADYDAFTVQYFSDQPAAVAQARQEMIDGMNAEFDQLQVDLQAYY